MKAMHAALSLGEDTRFDGTIIDTGANRRSVMSLQQYRAYCKEFKIPININRNDKRGLIGIGGKTKVLGSASIPVPFCDLGIVIDVEFRILEAKCPSLLSLRDLKKNGLDISIQESAISFRHKTQHPSFEDDFLKHKWHASDTAFAFYTEQELRRLHRVFGHPSVNALQNILRRANPDEFGPEVKQVLEDISKACDTCERYSSKLRRFKLSVGSEDLRFNHILAIDIMYLFGKPVLHAVDEATHYATATFMKSISAEDTWKALLRCWIRTYLGPPDHLRIDQGSNFVAKHFHESAEAEGISTLEAPIESPSTMTHVEQYHAPLRAAFKKIRDTLPRTTDIDADCLQLAVKSVNNTIGPEGLCPNLLVYGLIPRPPRRTPAETQLRRAKALDDAMAAVQKEQAKRRIAFALKHPSGPKHNEQEADLEKLPSGVPVLVYREKSKEWEGPFPFVHLDRNTVVVQMPTGRKIFRSIVVKPAPHIHSKENWQVRTDDEVKDKAYTVCYEASDDLRVRDSLPTEGFLTAMFGSGDHIFMNPNQVHTFVESRKDELKGLKHRETFEVVKRSCVPHGTRIYGTRWVDLIKIMNGKEVEKSRLVAQNYIDKAATNISTRSPTVGRMGQRVTVATAALFPDHTSYVRDISQAYIQSESKLERPVFLEPPPEMGLADDEILLAKKPLYGIPESGLHWFTTYHTHHREKLGMKACRSHICVLYRRPRGETADGITALQVDDGYGHGNKRFLDDEERESQRFQSKPRKLLRPGDSDIFNGCCISVHNDGIHSIRQDSKLRNLVVPKTKDDLVSTRALIQYIGSCTRPDLCAPSQLLCSSTANPDDTTFKKLTKLVKWCHEKSNIGLKFVPLDANKLRLMLFSDASFANANRLKSQLGFVAVLADGTGKANILHYGSTTCKRVARSVMAAELHALVYGFDSTFLLQVMLQELMGDKISIDAFVDSRTVFNVIAKQSNTVENRLQIDINALRQNYSNGVSTISARSRERCS